MEGSFSYWKGDAEARYFAHVTKLHIICCVALHIGAGLTKFHEA